MSRMILHAMTPLNFFMGLCAVRTLFPGQRACLDVLVYLPGHSADAVRGLATNIGALAPGFPEVRQVLAMTESAMGPLFAGSDLNAAATGLRSLLEAAGGANDYETVFYGHDVIDDTPSLLAAAYPQASTVCLGDSFGLFYERAHRLGLIGVPAWSNPLFPTRGLVPDAYAAPLPMECSPGLLAATPLTVVSREIVTAVFHEAWRLLPELRVYVDDLLSRYGSPGRHLALLLTETLAEAAYLSAEDDVAMYEQILRERCPAGSVVLIKAHPLSNLPRAKRLGERLAGHVTIVPVAAEHASLPIEFWQALIPACTVYCMSTPVLSLAYLYGAQVVNSMDRDRIRQWMPERVRSIFRFVACRDALALERLPHWDGKGPLVVHEDLPVTSPGEVAA